MQFSDAARATPAAAGRDPRGIDRLGGAINQTHITPALSTAIALSHGTREWWRLEAARIGSDWPAAVGLALDIIESTMFESDFERACRIAEAKQPRPASSRPTPRPTPRATIEAVMYCVRTRGVDALKEPSNQHRLRTFDAAARRELNERIRKLKGLPHV